MVTKAGWILLCTCLVSGCASLVRGKNQVEFDNIHKAAVVAFSVIEPVPKSLSFDLSKGGLSGNSNGGKFQQHSAYVESMWQELQRSLSVILKWKTLDKNAMTSRDAYKEAYTQTMKGWQNKLPPGQNKIQLNPADILDYDAARILGQEGRDKLLTALKVDALVVAQVDVQLEGTTVLGVGALHPKSVLNIRVFKKGIESPVWFDGNIEGKAMPSVGATALFDKQKLEDYALESAKDAFSKINDQKTEK